MALPTFKAAGTFTAGTGAITPPYPAAPNAPVANDIAILVCESENQAISLSSAQGFVELGNQANKAAGTAAVNPASRLAVYWKRCVGGDTAPTVADSGDHTTGRIYLFSGVKTSGNPWGGFSEGNDGGANDTTGVIPGATTTVNECLIFLICTSSYNGTSTAQFSGWANGTLANIVERGDNTNTAGLGGGHGSATGEKAIAGAYGDTTVTLAQTSFKGAMSIVLVPVLPVINTDFEGLTADAYIRGFSTTYSTARATSYDYTSTATVVVVGQKYASPNYYVYRSFLKFDTSSIGTDTITQVNLKLTCTYDGSTTDFDVQIIKQDWSGQDPLSDANREAAYDNCLAGTQDDNIWRNTNGIVENTQYASGNLNIAWVNKTGNTYYSLRSSRDKNADTPTGSEVIYLAAAEHATAAYRPVLTVLHEGAAPPTQTITGAGGIGSQEAFGTAMVALGLLASSILSGEAFGTPTVLPGAVTLQPAGIVSQETWGTPDIELTLAPSGIASEEAWGTPTIAVGPVTLEPSGIGSEEAFGQPTILPGPVTVGPSGIASAEAFGDPNVLPGPVTLQPGGIGSAEAFGTPSLTLIVEPSGITSGEAFGSPSLTLTIEPSGIASGEAFGTPTVILEGAIQTLLPTGIASGEAFGQPTLLPGPVTLEPTGIASTETFGSPELTLIIEPTGIASEEAWGTPTVLPGTVIVSPTGIASGEAFGQPILLPGLVTLEPSGIPGEEAFGYPIIVITHKPGYAPFYGTPKGDVLHGTAKRDVLDGTPKRDVLHGTPKRER